MYVISIEYQGKKFNSQSIDKDNPNIELMHLCQSQCPELENVRFFLNDHDEIMVQTSGNTPLVVERHDRKRKCYVNHPLMLFNHDVLWIGQNPIHCVDIKKIHHVEKSSSRISRVSKNTMLVSAAALAIMTTSACDTKPKPDPEPMGDCDCSEPCPPEGVEPPTCFGVVCCEPQPQETETNKDNADDQDPEPLPHPQVVGEPAIPEDELNDDEVQHPAPLVVGRYLPQDEPKAQADKDKNKAVDHPRPKGMPNLDKDNSIIK